MPNQKTSPHIGTLNEKPLHEALKRWYARPGDRFEIEVDGSIIDIVRDDLLIEIQTRGFGALKRKLEKLVRQHSVRLVYPIPDMKWIVRLAEDGTSAISRRKSPKRGIYANIFNELISLPTLILNPNFEIELLLIQEEEVRHYDSERGFRRHGWVTDEHRLLKVLDKRLITTPSDLACFIPSGLVGTFSTSDLAAAGAIKLRLAQKMVYCLRLLGCLKMVGKRGNSILYVRNGIATISHQSPAIR
jgi:hypothetical protein